MDLRLSQDGYKLAVLGLLFLGCQWVRVGRSDGRREIKGVLWGLRRVGWRGGRGI